MTLMVLQNMMKNSQMGGGLGGAGGASGSWGLGAGHNPAVPVQAPLASSPQPMVRPPSQPGSLPGMSSAGMMAPQPPQGQPQGQMSGAGPMAPQPNPAGLGAQDQLRSNLSVLQGMQQPSAPRAPNPTFPDSPRALNPQFSSQILQAMMGAKGQSPASLGQLLAGR